MNKKKIILTIVVIYVLLFNIQSYLSIQAIKSEFLQSRAGKYNSYDFLSYGITYGQNVEDVDDVMSDAELIGHNAITEGENWEGSVCVYTHKYSTEMFWMQTKVINEFYYAYFDLDGKVVKLKRLISGGPWSWLYKDVEIDLKEREIKSFE